MYRIPTFPMCSKPFGAFFVWVVDFYHLFNITNNGVYMSATAKNIKNESFDLTVGMGATICHYTDRTPCEIIRIISDKCVEVRDMNAVLDPKFKPNFIPGGFCGTVVNQHEQSYIYSSNPDATIRRARKRKNGEWYITGGTLINFGRAYKFHDYNF